MQPVLYVSYGMRKSGSSLAFRLARAFFVAAGHRQPPLPAAIERPRRANFFHRFGAAEAAALADHVARTGRSVVVKTHGPPSPALADLLSSGRAMAHAAYRDPREIALSMLDHGARSRETGLVPFSDLRTLDDTLEGIERQLRRLKRWLALPNVAPWAYDDFAFDHRAALARLAAQTGLSCDPEAVLAGFDAKTATQFNKARPQRWRAEMAEADSRAFLDRFADSYRSLWPERLAEGTDAA